MAFKAAVLALALAVPASGGALREAEVEAGLEAVVPAWLPPGYSLDGAEVIEKGRRKVLHLLFTDGEAALSLFQCPPRTRLALGGRETRRLRLAAGTGRLAQTREGPALAWTWKGSRFVLVGALPLEQLRRVADSLP